MLTYCGSHFTIYQIIILYTLSLYSVVCQFYLNKSGKNICVLFGDNQRPAWCLMIPVESSYRNQQRSDLNVYVHVSYDKLNFMWRGCAKCNVLLCLLCFVSPFMCTCELLKEIVNPPAQKLSLLFTGIPKVQQNVWAPAGAWKCHRW